MFIVEPQIKSVLDLLNSLENITAFGMTAVFHMLQ